MVIIRRETELEKLKHMGDWVWICGRRKTGKTFFVKRFLDFDEYFFVKRDGGILDKENREISFETFLELFRRMSGKRRIVIDEFHRIREDFFDYLHASKKGKLVAVSSTLWLSKRILGKGSPLMGLFSMLTFGLADEKDVLASLKHVRRVNGKEAVEASTYLREPILAFDYKPPIREYLARFLEANRLAVNEMIGEIFTEEERRLSLVYEGILRAAASGKGKSTDISSYLFSRRLIGKDNPGFIQRYLDVLVKIGLLERVEVYGKRSFVYRNVSPLFDLHFYLDEKYGYVENQIPLGFIRKVIDEKIPFHVERFFENLLAKHYGLKKVVLEKPEVDIGLVRFKRLDTVAEVKWKGRVGTNDLKNAEENMNSYRCRRVLIVPDKRRLGKKPESMLLLDAPDTLKFRFP